MKVIILVAVAITLSLLPSRHALARPKAAQNYGDIAMRSIVSLGQRGIGSVLIGGREGKSADWPASFYSKAVGERCTATLVGPRALLLAAHCVGDEKTATIKVAGVDFSGKCNHASEWKNGGGDRSADYAMCLLTLPVPNILYETIEFDPRKVKKGNKNILLTGFGCTKPPRISGGKPSGGHDGKYRIGAASVVSLPGEHYSQEPLELNTIIAEDNVIVCPGDSGGGAYLIDGAVTNRRLVSVISGVWFEQRRSYLSSLGTPTGASFVKKWVEANKEQVCGHTLKDKRCR